MSFKSQAIMSESEKEVDRIAMKYLVDNQLSLLQTESYELLKKIYDIKGTPRIIMDRFSKKFKTIFDQEKDYDPAGPLGKFKGSKSTRLMQVFIRYQKLQKDDWKYSAFTSNDRIEIRKLASKAPFEIKHVKDADIDKACYDARMHQINNLPHEEKLKRFNQWEEKESAKSNAINYDHVALDVEKPNAHFNETNENRAMDTNEKALDVGYQSFPRQLCIEQKQSVTDKIPVKDTQAPVLIVTNPESAIVVAPVDKNDKDAVKFGLCNPKGVLQAEKWDKRKNSEDSRKQILNDTGISPTHTVNDSSNSLGASEIYTSSVLNGYQCPTQKIVPQSSLVKSPCFRQTHVNSSAMELGLSETNTSSLKNDEERPIEPIDCSALVRNPCFRGDYQQTQPTYTQPKTNHTFSNAFIMTKNPKKRMHLNIDGEEENTQVLLNTKFKVIFSDLKEMSINEITNIIEKHGGSLTDDHNEADIILFHGEYTDHWDQQAQKNYGKPFHDFELVISAVHNRDTSFRQNTQRYVLFVRDDCNTITEAQPISSGSQTFLQTQSSVSTFQEEIQSCENSRKSCMDLALKKPKQEYDEDDLMSFIYPNPLKKRLSQLNSRHKLVDLFNALKEVPGTYNVSTAIKLLSDSYGEKYNTWFVYYSRKKQDYNDPKKRDKLRTKAGIQGVCSKDIDLVFSNVFAEDDNNIK